MEKMKVRQLNLVDLDVILATREIARFVVRFALGKKCKIISFKNTETASRSFLDELYIQSLENHIEIVDLPESTKPLFKLVEKSHQRQKMYAPKVHARLSDKVFA